MKSRERIIEARAIFSRALLDIEEGGLRDQSPEARVGENTTLAVLTWVLDERHELSDRFEMMLRNLDVANDDHPNFN